MPVISLPVQAMGPFGMPMLPGNGSSGGGGTTFGGKTIVSDGTPWVYDGPDSGSAVDVFTGLVWTDNGNKLVASIETAGSNNSYGIYEFSTTTAYSAQTADISFSSNFLTYNEIADADFSPQSIIFNSDGSKGFFIEDNELFGFDMSTNYDISTATGTGHTKTSLPNLYGPKDVKFNSDGTKMFVADISFGTPTLVEYSLSSAYDVTTRSQTTTFDPSTNANGGTTIQGIHFNSDGTKMWAIGSGGAGGIRYLYEYDLSTGFDLTTMSYNNERLDLETFAGIDLARAFTFDNDYYRLYIADGNDGILTLKWGTAPSSNEKDISDTTLVGNAPHGLFSAIGSAHTSSKWSTFGSNGTKFYVYGNANEIASYSLSTAYDITSASIDTNAMNPTVFLNPDGVIFNPNGDKIIFFETSSDPSIKQYDLNTPWNHTSIASTTPSATISNDPFYVQWDRGIFANSGSKFYAMQANSGGKIVEFTCSTPGDLATASAVGSSNELVWGTAQGNGESRGLAMSSDGKKLYVGFDLTGDANEQIFQYDLSTAFDLSTATYNNKVLSNLRNDNFAEIRGFYLVNDTDLYIQGLVNPSGGQGMWQYNIPQNTSGGGGSTALTDGWTVRSTFSGMSNERFYAIDNDTSGNFYTAGYDAVDDTILMASYDKDGAYRWSYKAGGTSDRLYDIGVDDPGNVIAVGYSISHTSGGTPFPGIVVKYASDGTHQWTKTLADNSNENWIPLAVAVKKNQSLGGDIYVAGATEAQSNSGNRNPFVVKLNSNGVVQWARKYDHGGQQSQPEGIALDSNGDIFVSGRIHEPITGGGYSSGMVMKLNGSDGTKIWDKIYDDGETTNGYHNDQFQNCAVTPEDDVVTCGWTNTNYLGSYYGTILKLSGTDGSIIWDRVTVENDGTKKIAVDSAGKIYTFTDSEVFFKYASDGTLEQEFKITASAASDAYYLEDINIDNKGNAILTGFHYTSGSDPAQPFITKLPATVQAGTSGDFVITAQTKGDGPGGMTLNTHTSYTANTMSNVTTNTANNLTPSSVSATTTGPNTVTGVSGGGGSSSPGSPDVSTASYSTNFDTANETTEPMDLQFNSDGTKLFVICNSTNKIFQYTTSNYSIASASYDSVFKDLSGTFATNINAFIFNGDGTSFYIMGNDQGGTTPDTIYQFDMSTAYDIANASYTKQGTTNNGSGSAVDNTPDKMIFNNDGTKIYITGRSTNQMYQFSLSTAYDISTISYDSVNMPIGVNTNYRAGMQWGHNGRKLYIIDGEGQTPLSLDVYSFTTPYDISTSGFNTSIDISGNGLTRPQGLALKPDGTGFIILDGHKTFATAKAFEFTTSAIAGGTPGENTGVTHSFGGGLVLSWTVQDDNVQTSERTLTNATLAASAQPGDVVVVENSTIQAYNSYNNIGWQLRDSGTLLFAIKAVNGNDLTILYAQEMIYRAQSTTTILNRDLKTYFDTASNERGDIPASATAGFSYDFNANGTTASQRWLGGTATLYRMFDSTIRSAWDTSGNSSAYATPMLDVTGDFTPLWSSSGGGGGTPGWISTISDELQGYGYPDTVIRSLAVDSSDNIYAGGDSMGNYQLVVKIKDDGTVISAASFGGSGATNNHRAIAVASDGSIYTAGEAKDNWNKRDGHVMRLTISLTKSYDSFFGQGYDDEHIDIAADNSGNVFAVGQSQSFAFNWSSNPKGHIVKHDSTGGQAKVLIGKNRDRSYPHGVSTDGTNPYVILKDHGYGIVIAKLNSALSSITWAKLWGASNVQERQMDIDTNSSGESAAHMWQVPELKVAKIDSSGNDTWRKVWSKASTDHGVADGSHILSGLAIKLLSNGSVALLAGPMPWTTQANKKSLYIVIFDSTGTVTYEKEFRLNNASHYLATAPNGNAKALVQLSNGNIVFAHAYYTGSNASGAGWRNAIFSIDPTDTTTAINGTHGDWDISDITDSTTSADGASWSSHTTQLDSNMSMVFNNGYQGASNGFNVSSATVVEGTQHTL